jgi:hypothetical protein
MKIAIFGDSYGSKYAQTIDYFKGWPEMLAEKYQVDNFAENGSNLYFSKVTFDRVHTQYDKIIFVVTAPGRIEFKIPHIEDLGKYGTWYRHIPTIWTIDARLTQLAEDLTDLDKKKYRTLYNYILDIQDIEYEQYIHNMMVNDIINKRPDTILIPGFPTSLEGQTECLESITRMEDNVFGKRTGFYIDHRKCHMSYKNNEILYEQVVYCLDNNLTRLDLGLDNFVAPDKNDVYLLEDWKK